MLFGKTLKTLLASGLVLAAAGLSYGQSTPAALPRPTPPPRAFQGDPPRPAPAPAEIWDLSRSGPKCVAPKEIRARLNPGERQVLVNVLCVKVPAGFCDRAGLGLPGHEGNTLTPREARMLLALLRAERERDVITSPQLLTCDGQEAIVQTGQELGLVTGLVAATLKNGEVVYTAKTSKVNVGASMQIAPKVSEDGRHVRLRVHVEHTCLGGTPVTVPVTVAGSKKEPGAAEAVQALFLERDGKPCLNVQCLESTVVLPDGGTAVVNGIVDHRGGKREEVLWILRAYVIEGPVDR